MLFERILHTALKARNIRESYFRKIILEVSLLELISAKSKHFIHAIHVHQHVSCAYLYENDWEKTHSMRFVKPLVSSMSKNANLRVKTILQYKTQLASLKYTVKLEKSKKFFEQSCGVEGGTHCLEPQF